MTSRAKRCRYEDESWPPKRGERREGLDSSTEKSRDNPPYPLEEDVWKDLEKKKRELKRMEEEKLGDALYGFFSDVELNSVEEVRQMREDV